MAPHGAAPPPSRLPRTSSKLQAPEGMDVSAMSPTAVILRRDGSNLAQLSRMTFSHSGVQRAASSAGMPALEGPSGGGSAGTTDPSSGSEPAADQDCVTLALAPAGVAGVDPGGGASDAEEDGDDSRIGGRVFVFAVLSLGVQAFMSYSGGATPASLPAIQAANPGLTQLEISLLGSLDKIGQVVASPLWGRALQRFPTKSLLIIGLALNSLFSLQFGFVRSKDWMFLAKFMQGCTESQQIVWGNLWTAGRAPPRLLSTWMNLGGVAAGLGTAVGQAVAGFSNNAGMPYSFAYTVQAVCLALCWVALVFTPGKLVRLPGEAALEARAVGGGPSTPGSEGASASSGNDLSVGDQLRALRGRRLYWLTMICVAENNFITGGLQFFWTRFFCSGPWTLDLGTVTAAGLLVQGVGMGLGIFIGPILVNKYGGYQDDLGRYVTMHLMLRITAFGTLGAGLAVLSMGIQLSAWNEDAELLDSSLRNPWLWTFWLATVPINFALSAQGGVQTVINIGSVPPGTQELAQGLTTSVQFLCGYAGGVIVPSIILDVAYHVSLRLLDYEMSEGDQLATGVLVICSMCVVLLVTVFFARNEAYRLWARSHQRALVKGYDMDCEE